MHIVINLYFPTPIDDADAQKAAINDRLERVNEMLQQQIVSSSSYARGGGMVLADDDDPEQNGMVLATYDVGAA